jgi:hypothetical protein
LGSPSGLSGSPAWTAESDQTNSSFGYSVSTAGDVNGDGYGDVIVGAYTYSNDQANEGRAYVYLGNDGRGGWLGRVQQRKKSDLAPLATFGKIGMDGLFRIRADFPKNLLAFSWATGVTPLAYLQWEIEPLSVPFDSLGIQGSPGQALVPVGGTLTFDELTAVGFVPPKLRDARSTAYHWRARIATNNPLFPHTAWFASPQFELRKRARHP